MHKENTSLRLWEAVHRVDSFICSPVPLFCIALLHSFHCHYSFQTCSFLAHCAMSAEKVAKRARLGEAAMATTGTGAAEYGPALQALEEAIPAQPTAVHAYPRATAREDPMVFFSEEISLHILELLTPAELGQCACVSRQWYRLVNDQMVSPVTSFNIISTPQWFQSKVLITVL